MEVEDASKASREGGGSAAIHPFPSPFGHGDQRAGPVVSFDRNELREILNLYGRRVAEGEWRDYAIAFSSTRPCSRSIAVPRKCRFIASRRTRASRAGRAPMRWSPRRGWFSSAATTSAGVIAVLDKKPKLVVV